MHEGNRNTFEYSCVFLSFVGLQMCLRWPTSAHATNRLGACIEVKERLILKDTFANTPPDIPDRDIALDRGPVVERYGCCGWSEPNGSAERTGVLASPRLVAGRFPV